MNPSKKNVRRHIKPGKKLHTAELQHGLHLGYRKCMATHNGTWTVRRWCSKDTKYEFHVLQGAIADDGALEANNTTILSFDEAATKARKWALKREQEERGEIVGGSYTVKQAMDDYIAHSARERKIKVRDEKGRIHPKLFRVQAVIDAFILPTLGGTQLDELNHTTVKAWRDALADTAPRVRTRVGREQVYRKIDQNDPDAVRARQASVNRVLTVLKAALNHAKAQKRVASDSAWVDVKPFREVDVPKVRFLTIPEVNTLMPACDEDFGKLVKGALLTGCRLSELTAMTIADFNQTDGNVYVAKSKNGEARYVHLNAAGIQFFSEIADGRQPTERLFLRNGKPWKESEQQRPMDTACKAAKIEGVTFHILRHTYASHSLMNGMTIEVLAKQLGHKDTRITLRHYAHLCPQFAKQSAMKNAPSFGFAGVSEASIASQLVQ